MRSTLPVLFLLAAACSVSTKLTTDANTAAAAARPKALSADLKGSGGARCNAATPDREASEYDTSGDEHPDVRKVFMRLGSGVDSRLIMICRESDLNGDGKKDVIRYYDDEGRSLREEADRNFDGKMDQSIIYQDGAVVRKEFDDNHDGKIDLKVYFDKGKAVRAERDITGRSSATQWRPDRWEYFEDGRVVRMGTDLDGDARVDRWDRDQILKRAKDKAKAEEAAKAKAEEAAAEEAEEAEDSAADDSSDEG